MNLKRTIIVSVFTILLISLPSTAAVGDSWRMDTLFADWEDTIGATMVNGVWSLKMGDIHSLTDWSRYDDMVYDPLNVANNGARWEGWYDAPDPYNTGRPMSQASDSYDVWPCLRVSGSADPCETWRTIPALVFTAPEDGCYQWHATDRSQDNSGNRGYQRRHYNTGDSDQFLKVSLDSSMTSLGSVTYTGDDNTWVEPQSKFRCVPLMAGEKLVLAIVNSGSTWYNGWTYTGDTRYNTEHGFIEVHQVEQIRWVLDKPFGDWGPYDPNTALGSQDPNEMIWGQWSLKMGKVVGLDENLMDPENPSTWSNYQPMIYDESVPGGRWIDWYPTADPYNDGTPQSTAYERYGLQPALRAVGSTDPCQSWRTMPTVLFTSDTNAFYNVAATDQSKFDPCHNGLAFEAGQEGQYVAFYKVALNDTMTELARFTAEAAGTYWIQPGDIQSLQGVPLLADESLAVVLSNQSTNGCWWDAYLYTGDSESNTEHGYLTVEISNAPGNCQAVWLGGYGLATDANKDCYVNIQDFAYLFDDWMNCYDPDNENCEQTW